MTGAERQRIYRQRRRDGRIRVTVELDQDDLDALVARKLLCEWDRNDRSAIERALQRAKVRLVPDEGGDA